MYKVLDLYFVYIMYLALDLFKTSLCYVLFSSFIYSDCMYAHLDNQQIKVFKRKHGHIGVFLNPLHKRRDTFI